VVAEYIQKQAEHHRQKSFQEESLTLLMKHGVEIDERYVWDWRRRCAALRVGDGIHLNRRVHQALAKIDAKGAK
jgi:hypothetical protein